MQNRIRPSLRILLVPFFCAATLLPFTSRASAAELNVETQDRLTLRYNDRALLRKVLNLEPEKLGPLYAEVLEAIEGKYVDEVKLERLLSRGVDNIEQALYNPAFLEAIAPKGLDPARLARYRDGFRKRWGGMDAENRAAAVQKVIALALDAKFSLALSPKSNSHNLFVLEFVFAACESLDPHSAYLTPEHIQLYRLLDKAEVAGIGIDLARTQPKQPLTVSYVLPRSPADVAEIRPGDAIIRIGDTPTAGLTPIEAQILLHGAEGTKVVIEVKDGATGKQYVMAVARLNPDMPSIGKVEMIDPEAGIGYIQLQIFTPTTLADLDKALATLREQGMRGLVLDLRGNPGGSFLAALQVADRFLSEGVIVATTGRANGTTTHTAGAGGDTDSPLVVLVDGETASSAEIVAAALKDHRRGTLVGGKTFGKGSVQGTFQLKTMEGALRLTTAKYITPRGNSLAGVGISPDVVVDAPGGMPAEVQEAQNKTAIQEIRRLMNVMPPMGMY